jgi:hypothetical protein
VRKSVRTPGHVSDSYLEEQHIRETLAFPLRPARILHPNGVEGEQSRHHPERLRKAKTADRSEPITQVPPK